MLRSHRATGIAAALVTVAIWTGFIIIGRASAAHTLLPFDIALLRIVGAGAVLLPWGWWLVRRTRAAGASSSLLGLSPLALRPTLLTGLFGGFVYAGLCYAGFFYAPAAHASVLMPGSLPLWTTLLAVLLLGERIALARVLGLACILAGGLLVGGEGLLSAFDGGEVWKGDLIFMAAAFCWSIYTVLARQFALDAVRATIAITVFACFSYVPLFALLTASGLLSTRLGAAPWGEIMLQALFQGVGSVVVAGITFVHMVRAFGPVRSTMITALVPGLSALGAVLLLGEPLGWNLLAGLALVTAGILLGVRAARQSGGAGRAADALPVKIE
ncbi:DMT family transporter [Ottowia sp.]|uniref:DMT family transporter n=1 Tax=Ottowia sp. TaxID=1898956 RepID=UPI002CDB7B3A|nr:DMT family transporter [Ottowia sp.]HRN76457.1 DMT family transporter [Ottowia sp.]HRQ02454.1 DMT family transporter [Ottowia sp.]